MKVLESKAAGKATDTRLYVQESGRPGSPAVVFLPGAGASGRMWRQHTARLAGRFHCLAPDLPGFGHSNQLASASVLSPLLHTRAVTALFSTMIGMDQEGRAERRASSRRAFWRAFWEGFKPPPFRIAIDAPCPTLLVAGEQETTIRASNAALATLMPHAVARFAPGVGHGWLARRPGLHVRMVEAWLTGQQLPSELIPEAPSPSAVERLLRQIGGESTHANDAPAS